VSESAAFEILAIGAHPDDVEVGVGGLVAKLTRAGKRVAILDLTEGERGSRGTVEERRIEAEKASKILGVAHRFSARLPDGGIANIDAMRREIVEVVRALRPAVLIAPMHTDRHPDHDAAHYLVRDANYLAGLQKFEGAHAPHRAGQVYYYRVYGDWTPPSAVIDVSETFEIKQAALRAYASQFFNPEYEGTETYVSSEAFWNGIVTRAAYWGSRIGRTYGEPVYTDGPIGLATLPGL